MSHIQDTFIKCNRDALVYKKKKAVDIKSLSKIVMHYPDLVPCQLLQTLTVLASSNVILHV